MANSSKKDRANAQFGRLQRAHDAPSDYEAGASATRAKTERLKALRLARDAAAPATSAKPPAAPKSKSVRTKKGAGGNLSDWLKEQQGSGRNH